MTEPAALRRRLTAELRRLRAAAKLTQRQVADALDWSPSKVIRIEQGTVRIGVTDLQALLYLYDVTDPESIVELTTMARESKKLPFVEYRDVMSALTLRYLQYEANASIIRQVALDVVPGLLQTEEYSRALFEANKIDRIRADRLVESHKERRELFDKPDPPEIVLILDESVIRRTVGGAKVMQHQLEHLIEMSRWPNICIQVLLSFTVGAHPALAGSFVILEFPRDDDADVVFSEERLR